MLLHAINSSTLQLAGIQLAKSVNHICSQTIYICIQQAHLPKLPYTPLGRMQPTKPHITCQWMVRQMMAEEMN